MNNLEIEEEKKIAKKHIVISAVVTVVLLILLYSITPFLIKLFLNPQEYLGFIGLFKDFTNTELQIAILCILSYKTVVLIGYIVYLILTSYTRSELISGYKTRDLSASKDELEDLYENAPVPYLTLDKDGDIKGCNKAALRFFGVLPEEIAEKSFFGFASEEDLDLGDKFLNYYKSDYPIDSQEIRLITKKNGVKWASLSIFLTRDFITGEKNGLVTVFDITEQKQLDQAKTEFVSLASHQLRTPLATVKWYTEMLNSEGLGPLNEKQKDYLKRVSSVNIEMVDLVETLLNVSRIEIGKLAINKHSKELQR